LCLVESDPRAIRVIRANIAALGLDGAQVRPGRVEAVLAKGPDGAPFDVAMADPPYAMPGEAVTAMLTALTRRGWLATGALLAVERSTRSGPVEWPEGYAGDRSRRYGEATFWYGHATGEPQP
jgi:16S rRNA G966 N2-methylase RsmD